MDWIPLLLIFFSPTGSLDAVQVQSEPDTIDRASLEIAVDLASDVSQADREARARILGFLYDHVERTDIELVLARMIPRVSPDSDFRTLAVPADTTPAGYLAAVLESHARLLGAQQATSQDWTRRQREAMTRFATLAAISLEDAARLDDKRVENLAAKNFAVRRSSDAAEAFRGRLRTQGLAPAHRELLLWSGWSDHDIEMYRQALIAAEPARIGISMVELVESIAGMRRGLAVQLREIAATAEVPQPDSTSDTFLLGNPDHQEPLASTFTIGNPLDREATVDLIIHRTSIAPDWRLAIVNADPDTSATADVATIREVEAGRHYQVRLPAGEQVRGASIVHPAGRVGENTRVEWAVEGRIGSELIGGFVQVMNMPEESAAAEAPPITTAPRFGWRTLALGSGILVVVIGAIGLVFLRRRTEARA